MSWIYLDDGFPDHPKVTQAGGDAAWLFICGLAYCKRYKTEGRIPKAMVTRLSDRKAPTKLAVTLVGVGLWHDQGDHYQVHDFDDWNGSAEQRSERARKAAQARWSHASSNANGNARSIADASAEHVPRDALVPVPVPVPKYLQVPTDVNQCRPQAVENRDGEEQKPNKHHDIAYRIAAICAGHNRQVVNDEAIAVACWASLHVDMRIVDEAIGALTGRNKPPNLPRAVARLVQQKASDYGIAIPDFVPNNHRSVATS